MFYQTIASKYTRFDLEIIIFRERNVIHTRGYNGYSSHDTLRTRIINRILFKLLNGCSSELGL